MIQENITISNAKGTLSNLICIDAIKITIPIVKVTQLKIPLFGIQMIKMNSKDIVKIT